MDLLLLFGALSIRFESLKVKLQSFSGDVSALKVYKLNTNYAIKGDVVSTEGLKVKISITFRILSLQCANFVELVFR